MSCAATSSRPLFIVITLSPHGDDVFSHRAAPRSASEGYRPGMTRSTNMAASHQSPLPGFVLAMPLYPSKTIQVPGLFLAIFVFSIGFFIQCNVLTSNLGLRFLNITDMLVLMTLPVIALLYIRCLTPSIILLYLVPLTIFLHYRLFLPTNVAKVNFTPPRWHIFTRSIFCFLPICCLRRAFSNCSAGASSPASSR
ncbi:membrane hypothetical protein [Agrobacterium fabacearum S56]|nr:membrane hypothetical protein [Agrobacterium fabacearum S56]